MWCYRERTFIAVSRNAVELLLKALFVVFIGWVFGRVWLHSLAVALVKTLVF